MSTRCITPRGMSAPVLQIGQTALQLARRLHVAATGERAWIGQSFDLQPVLEAREAGHDAGDVTDAAAKRLKR